VTPVRATVPESASGARRGVVLRWGRSAYETEVDLALEETAARALGLGWRAAPESEEPPDLAGVDVLVVTSRVRVDAAVLAAFPGSLVLTTTSGWDHVDVDAAVARGVAVARCPLARRDAVAEQAVAGIATLLRRQPAFDLAAREGRWARGELPDLDPIALRDATVHVVGLGVIGRRVAELLATFGAAVLGTDPQGVPAGVEEVELEAGLARADAVTLHCALVPSSRGLMSAARIRALRTSAVLVNTARGHLVDVDAAVAAVRERRLRGLMLDVFPREPWPGLAAAAAVPGVLLTPHSSGFTRDLGTRVAGEVAGALAAWAHRRPVPHQVSGAG
jgi:D-3-phosphoglycerate dehydrogenase / 2-oxoglutarate reductase